MSKEIIELARIYSDYGWPMIPIVPREKRPLIASWQQGASLDLKIISNWLQKWPSMNLGIVTGPQSKLLVLDVDPRNEGDRELNKLEREFGALPPTPCSVTGGGGQHILFHLANSSIR